VNAADQNRTPPKWTDIANDPDFKAADWQTKQRVRGEFYRRAVEPELPEDLRADVQSQFFSRTEADVFGERESDDSQAPGFASNALRNAGERGLDLVGNAIQFAGNVAEKGERRITEALGGINPGVIGGSAEEMRARGYEPDVELGGYGVDFTMRAKPEDTSTGLIDTGQAVEDISLGYQPNYTIDRALDNPSLKTLAGAAAEQGPAALADMAGLVVSLPAYLASRTQEIGEARVRNDNREGMPEGRDYAVSGPTAAASVLLDRFALGRLLPGGKNAVTSIRQIPGAVGRAAGTEGLTEAIQEGGIEYAGESVGTETGWNPVTAGRRAAGGVIVGAPTGGAVRGATAGMELSGNSQRGNGEPVPTEQPTPTQETAPSPEAETANVEAVGTAAELIGRPRFELSSAEREARDSISYGDAFKSLRAEAESRGDTEAVTELDAISGDIAAALEAETMARASNDVEALAPVRVQLQGASARFSRVMERLNAPDASSENGQAQASEDGDAEWARLWREEGVQNPEQGVENAPTIDISGSREQVAQQTAPNISADIESARQAVAQRGGDALQQAVAGQAAESQAQASRQAAESNPGLLAQRQQQSSDIGRRIDQAMANVDSLQSRVRDSGIEGGTRLRKVSEVIGRADKAVQAGNIEQATRLMARAENISNSLSAETDAALINQQSEAAANEQQLNPAPTTEVEASLNQVAPAQASANNGDAPVQNLQFRTSGQPFASERAAMSSGFARRAQRNNQPVSAVPVEGGFALDMNPQAQPASQTAAEPSATMEANAATEINQPVAPEPQGASVGAKVTHSGRERTIADTMPHPTAGRQLVSFEDAPGTYVFADEITDSATPGAQASTAESSPQAGEIVDQPATPVNTGAASNEAPVSQEPVAKKKKPSKPPRLTPRQQRVSEAFGGAVAGDTVTLLNDVGYAKAGNAYTIDSINKDGTLQATNKERGSSVLISQGEWTLATRRAKAPVAEVVQPDTSSAALDQEHDSASASDDTDSSTATKTEPSQQSEDQKYSLKQDDTRPINRKDIEQALAGSPELADVTVIQSTTDLPPQSLLMMALQGVNPRDVRGLFVGDQLYVIADNVDSVQDGVRTAVHEAVGHKGIRGVLGEELEPVMRQVYRSLPMDKRGKEALQEVLESYPFLDQTNPEHQLTIAEEMIAHLTEKGWNPGPVRRAVAKIREMLRRIFPKMKWTDADVMALSKQSRKWLSDQQANEQGAVDAEADMRFSMATPPGGNFDPNDSTNFSLPDESLKQTALRKMADKMNRLKVTQEVIKKAGGNINEDNNAYLAEELFHGKTEHDLNKFSDNYVEKLAKGMARRNIKQEELDAYLYARHAPERNARIAERNPNDPKYADGGSGMTNAEAAAIMQEVENGGKKSGFEQLAAIVDDMLRHRRETMRDGGLESSSTLDAWDASYEYYVPLKGWANDEDVPTGQEGGGRMRSGKGFEIRGKEAKTALGRLSKAASPSTQAIVDTTESIIRSRKNEVGNALLSMITDNPNPSLWQVFTSEKPDTQRTKVTRKDPDTGEERIEVVERPVAMDMNEAYFKTKKLGRTYYIKINDQRLMNAMRNVGPEQNGIAIQTMASATRLMSAMMTSYNPEFMLTNFARDIQTAMFNIGAEQTRDDGKIKGQKIAKQAARDIPRAMKAAYRGLSGKAGNGSGNAQWDRWFTEFMEDGAKTGYFDAKDLKGQAKEIRSIMGRANGGTLGNMMRAKKSVADFVENMNGAVENAVRLSAYVNARRVGVSRKQSASLAKNLTVNFNRRGEAGTALNAAYMFANASIQGTMNVARTMATVKNAPVGSSRMNIWNRMNTAQKLAVGMGVGSYALAMFNRMLSDEDDDGELFYDKIPDHVKERSLVLMTGGKDYIKVPLPYGYNVFSVVGTHAEKVAAGQSSLTDAGKNLGLAILGSFSPIGFQDSDDAGNLLFNNATPTLVRSVSQVVTNEDFAGRTIYPEDGEYGIPTPDSSRAFRSTPEAYKSISMFINELTGGSEYRSGWADVSPDVLQHVVNYYGGGAWGFTEKVTDGIKRVATGEKIETYRIPFAGRFASSVSEYGDIQTFYERRNEIGQLSEEFNNMPREEVEGFYAEYGDKIALHDLASDTRKTLAELRKVQDAIQQDERLTTEEREAQLDEIEEAMDAEVDFFNLLYNEAEGKDQSEK
tara:strand:+ start:40804 stop:47319 length:6516 start_codon:yes stop_codon:yes gene_type:complete